MIDKLIGIVLIIIGPLQIRNTYKNRILKNDYGASNFKGYMVGFFLVVIGILLLLGYGNLTEEIVNKFKYGLKDYQGQYLAPLCLTRSLLPQ